MDALIGTLPKRKNAFRTAEGMAVGVRSLVKNKFVSASESGHLERIIASVTGKAELTQVQNEVKAIYDQLREAKAGPIAIAIASIAHDSVSHAANGKPGTALPIAHELYSDVAGAICGAVIVSAFGGGFWAGLWAAVTCGATASANAFWEDLISDAGPVPAASESRLS
jgi:hypothetical protein